MHCFYFLIYEVRSMFHGRRWRNLSGSNTSMLVIFVNTFLKYFSGSDWLSLPCIPATAPLRLQKLMKTASFFSPSRSLWQRALRCCWTIQNILFQRCSEYSFLGPRRSLKIVIQIFENLSRSSVVNSDFNIFRNNFRSHFPDRSIWFL